MDNELDYIISSYASLKLNSLPLKDVNLNSPAKLKPISPQKRSNIITNSPQEIHKLCLNSIDIVLKNFKSVKSLNSSFLRLASSAFTQLYKLNILDRTKDVFKKHQLYILKLIELEDELHDSYFVALREIKAAHQQATPNDKDPIDAVLLEKSQTSLKFLVLQVLFKQFQQGDFNYLPKLLEFFGSDSSFLEDLASNQKASIVKLLLSFVKLSPSTQFKECLNLKFLQYIHQFGLNFKTFITNLSEEKFASTIQKEIMELNDFGLIPIFLFKYLETEHDQIFDEAVRLFKGFQSEGIFPELKWNLIIPDVGSSNNLTKLLSLPRVNIALVRSELENFGRPTAELHEKIGGYILSSMKSPSDDLESIILYYLTYTDNVNKLTSPILDKFVMSSTNFISSPEFLQKAFMVLQKLFIKHDQSKRLKNVSNLFYNFALKMNSPAYVESFLTCCLKIEQHLYQKTHTLEALSTKFEKSLRYVISQNLPVERIFTLVWNNDFMDGLTQTELLQKFDLLDEFFSNTFQFFPFAQTSFLNLSQENRAITFAICSKYSQNEQLSAFYKSLNIDEPIFQMFCGVYHSDVPYVHAQHPQSQPAVHSSALLKSAYYLTLEMKTKSTLNITKILHLYKNSWLIINKEEPTLFELHFLEQMVNYLKFINFQKSLNELLRGISKYNSLNSNGFEEWYKIENLDNIISMKDIMSLNVQALDPDTAENDFESPTDAKIRRLEFLVLKLKYHLVLADKNALSQTAVDIERCIEQNPDLLSAANKNSYPKKQFKHIISLLTKLHYQSAKLFKFFGNHMAAITSAKVCAQLSRSILKKDTENLQVLSFLCSSFRHLISTLIHLGASKDADFYIEEFTKLNESIMKHKPLYVQNNYFICYYLYVTARYQELSDLRAKSDKIFKMLGLFEDDNPVDNYKVVFYHYLAKIYDVNLDSKVEVRQKLRSFLSYVEKEGKMLSNLWRLHYEYHFNAELIDLTINKSKDPNLHAMNYIINCKRLFTSAKRTLEIDPVFSTLEDSAMSIPSTFQDQEVPETSYSVKGKTKSMRNIKKSILELRQSRNFILELFGKLNYMANYQVDEVHKILALGLLTLSSISNTFSNELLDELFNLGEYLKNNPFVNEKKLIEATSKTVDLLPNFMIGSANISLLDQSVVDPNLMEKIPEDWLVISVDVCSFNGDLLISKINKGMKAPSLLRLPLSRHSSRTIDEESFSFEDAMKELRTIIEESNKTTSKVRVSSINTLEDRQKWHQERYDLDIKLCEFLDKIEYCWIGGFKGIFNQNKVDLEQKSQFREKFLGILGQNIPSRSQRNQNSYSIQIDDFIIELFLSLGDPSELVSTELLEDLIYFVLDILLFHGEENAYDEIDIDNIYVEVEALIKEYLMMNHAPPKYKHTILIVGKECQSIPWESLPSLRGSSTTRMPSLSMLLKRLGENEKMVVNKRNGSFVLNPSGDLVKTEGRFEEQIEDLCQNLNWKGMTGKKPSEDEFAKYVHDSNLFVYIGHGGGEQFIRSTTLKKMDKIAPSLLLGCSSAALHDNNFLEPYGTVYSYLVGGCPMILGNLWDVTDKDIDKFSLSLLKKWGLSSSQVEKSMNISDAVRLSRDECKLRFLNGAAPVIYGLPLSLL